MTHAALMSGRANSNHRPARVNLTRCDVFDIIFPVSGRNRARLSGRNRAHAVNMYNRI